MPAQEDEKEKEANMFGVPTKQVMMYGIGGIVGVGFLFLIVYTTKGARRNARRREAERAGNEFGMAHGEGEKNPMQHRL